MQLHFRRKFVSNENAYFVQRKNSSLPVEFAAHRYSALPYSIAFWFHWCSSDGILSPHAASARTVFQFVHTSMEYISVIIYIVACCALSSEDIPSLSSHVAMALCRLAAIFNFILFSLRRLDESYVAAIVSNQLRLLLLLLRSSMVAEARDAPTLPNTYYIFDGAFLLKHLPETNGRR